MNFFFVHEYVNEYWAVAIMLAQILVRKLQIWNKKKGYLGCNGDIVNQFLNRFHTRLVFKEVCSQFHLSCILGVSKQWRLACYLYYMTLGIGVV